MTFVQFLILFIFIVVCFTTCSIKGGGGEYKLGPDLNRKIMKFMERELDNSINITFPARLYPTLPKYAFINDDHGLVVPFESGPVVINSVLYRKDDDYIGLLPDPSDIIPVEDLTASVSQQYRQIKRVIKMKRTFTYRPIRAVPQFSHPLVSISGTLPISISVNDPVGSLKALNDIHIYSMSSPERQHWKGATDLLNSLPPSTRPLPAL